MKVIECFEIQRWDGGDRHNHAFYLSSEEEKNAYLAKNPHDIVLKRTFVIFDSLAEVADNQTEKVRERALAKLTPLEKKALGFDV